MDVNILKGVQDKVPVREQQAGGQEGGREGGRVGR